MGANRIISDWQIEFTDRIRKETGSHRKEYLFKHAKKECSQYATELDKVFLSYIDFIDSKPLDNDYYKFVNSYKQGKKLDVKYFRHNVDKLHDYYKKVDENPEFTPFSQSMYESYVLFMMLKLKGVYNPEYDADFGVKIVGSREYNPLTSIPSVLRGELPFKIKEYDIAQAYPTFVFNELGIKPFDVYSLIEKRTFNILLNTHKDVKNATIEAVRSQLEPIYKDRVNEVITEDRFNEKGRLFEDLAKHEKTAIENFVHFNNLDNFVRLHDGVVTASNIECEALDFGNVKFKIKTFEVPIIDSEIVNFYKDGKTSPSMYAKFLEQEKFIRVTREGDDSVLILKNEGKIIAPFNHRTDLVPFLKDNINEFDTSFIEDKLAKDSVSVIQSSLLLLKPIELKYHKDTKTTTDIPFKNGIVRITADKMEIISYDKIVGFFPKHSTQKHEISIDTETESDFKKFLQFASGKENFPAFCSMFGYLISNFKNPALNPAIILSDEGADGEIRAGGRGKSKVQEALSYFRPSITKGGRAYDPNYTHVHGDLKREHDLYFIDDVPCNFNYNDLYTNITGSIDAQRKGTVAETISFEDAPKFVVTTNWVVRHSKEATSTNRRFREYKFTDFFNMNNTPEQVLGRLMFIGWNADDWNSFYNFGFYCVQQFLKHGLSAIEYNKDEDNFRAVFNNDVMFEEMERFFDTRPIEFSVSDFLSFHTTNEMFRLRSLFNHKNAKECINTFIAYEKWNYKYNKQWKKWRNPDMFL